MIAMRLRKVKSKVGSMLKSQNAEDIDYDEEKSRILAQNRQYLSSYDFDEEPFVSIVVLNRNGLKYLKILFDDFQSKTNYTNYEIILVDNASDDGSVEYVKSLDMDIRIIENRENLSFSKANNDAADIANGEYILFLNNDIEPTYGWLNEMVGTMVYGDNVGAVGAKLIFPHIENSQKEKHSFSIQHYGGIFREQACNQFDYAARHQDKFSKDIFNEKFLNNKKCIIATAAVFLIRKDLFLKLDKFDEQYWYGFEDVDLNLKLYEAGYDVVVASAALLLHYESVTRKKEKKQNYVVLNDKWGDFLFKELLLDKLKKKYFLTDKKLNILIIGRKFPKDIKLYSQLRKAIMYLKSQDYNATILDNSFLDIGRNFDVVVSATEDYDIKNIDARNNIIKILLLKDDNFSKNKCDGYDIVIGRNINPDLPNSYSLDDYNNLGKELISVLMKKYMD